MDTSAHCVLMPRLSITLVHLILRSTIFRETISSAAISVHRFLYRDLTLSRRIYSSLFLRYVSFSQHRIFIFVRNDAYVI